MNTRSEYEIVFRQRNGPFGEYRVVCLGEIVFNESNRPVRAIGIAEFGNEHRPESLKHAQLLKSVLDLDKDALRRQYEMASKLSEHLSSEDYEVFTGLLHLIEELLK